MNNMAKKKTKAPEPEAQALELDYKTEAKPKGHADGIPVFCAHDAIVKVADLKQNPRNPNTHPEEQIQLLAGVIEATGWRGPITVSTRSGYIVRGHGRLMAAGAKGWTEVPIDYQEYASEAEEMADLIADNRIAELSEISNVKLAEAFAAVDTGEVPFELTGFTPEEYGDLVTALSENLKNEVSDPDQYIEPPEDPLTKLGDIWILGNHRVMCGDSRNAKHREQLLDGAQPAILCTDPPYCSGGHQESGKSTGSIGTVRKGQTGAPMIANDILSTRGYINLLKEAFAGITPLYAYVFTDWKMWLYLYDIMESSGFGIKSMLVWDKETPGMGMGWRSQHELIMFASRGKTQFDGHKGYSNVLRCTRSGNPLHPTQKPTELIEKLLDNTDWCEGVYDPFGGSGTTLMAAEAVNQKSYIMELTPAFTDTIVKRYVRATGKKSIRCIRDGIDLTPAELAPIFEETDEGELEQGGEWE